MRATALLLLAFAALLTPFLSRPFFFDDPVMVISSTRAGEHPLRPYDYTLDLRYPGETMWPRGGLPAHTHPPLPGWTLGSAIRWAQAQETGLHVVMLGLFLVALTILALLAYALRISPVLAVAATAFSPAIFLSVLTFYPHAFYWAAYLGAFYSAWRLMQQPSSKNTVLLGLCWLLAAFSLHQWPLLLVLMAALAFVKAGPASRPAFIKSFAFFVVVYGFWMAWETSQYGIPQVVSALKSRQGHSALNTWTMMLPLIFLGGGWPAAFFVWPALWKKSKPVSAAIAACGAGLALVFALPSGGFPLEQACMAGLFFLGGAGFVAWALERAWKGDAMDRLLACWFLVEWLFVQVFLTVPAGHHLLVALVPAALLWARHAETWIKRRSFLYAGLVAMAALSWTLARADVLAARVAPRAAMEFQPPEAAGRRLIWGNDFGPAMFYFKRAGWKMLDIRETPVSGDWVLLPTHMNTQGPLPPLIQSRLELVAVKTYRSDTAWRTFSIPAGAGWYSASWGALPYAWWRGPAEEFRLYRVKASPKTTPTASMPTSTGLPTRPTTPR